MLWHGFKLNNHFSLAVTKYRCSFNLIITQTKNTVNRLAIESTEIKASNYKQELIHDVLKLTFINCPMFVRFNSHVIIAIHEQFIRLY